MAMRPIQTSYRGYFFRSRLEARWAVFFDSLKIKWEYEPEGYHLSDGEMYLPDFWLPNFCGGAGIFAEVKPERVVDEKAKRLAMDSGRSVLMACGVPSAMAYQYIYSDGSVGESMFAQKYLPGGSNASEYRLFSEPGIQDEDGSIEERFMDHSVLAAIVRARSARFEHGQKGGF
jgi:hypothetical protein